MGEAAVKLDQKNEAQVTSKTEVEKVLRKLETLPTLPNIVYELNRIVNNPLSSASDVSKVIERDQSLAAKVLKMVNSAYYGIPGGISNLNRAISYLGFDIVNQLVLTATVFNQLNKKNDSSFDMKQFWKHAVGTAMTAELIAKWSKFQNPADCFSCGLLHDLGKIALYMVAPEFLDQIVKLAQTENLTILQAEIKSQSVPHTHVGSMLATLWKLPPIIESSILYHHEFDIKKRNIIKPETNRVVDIVCFANSLMHDLGFGNSGHNQTYKLDGALLARIQLNAVQVPLILKDLARTLETAEDFIKVVSE